MRGHLPAIPAIDLDVFAHASSPFEFSSESYLAQPDLPATGDGLQVLSVSLNILLAMKGLRKSCSEQDLHLGTQ